MLRRDVCFSKRGHRAMSETMTLQVYFGAPKETPSSPRASALDTEPKKRKTRRKNKHFATHKKATLPWCQHHSDCYFWFHSTCPLKKNACGWSDPFHFWRWCHCVPLLCERSDFYDSVMLLRHLLRICWIHAWHSCWNDSSYWSCCYCWCSYRAC